MKEEEIPEDVTDADDLFGDVDFNDNPVKIKSVESLDDPSFKVKATPENPFAGVEQVLGLPNGSTKQGLAIAKEEVKKVKDEAKNLSIRARSVSQKTKLAKDMDEAGLDEELGEAFNMDTLARDRKMLRDEYIDLFKRGKKMLDTIETEMENLVNPGPDDYGNFQRQYAVLLSTLNGVKDALVMLRKEEEIYSQRTGGVGVKSGGFGGAPGGAIGVPAEPGLDPNEESMEMTTRDTNAAIEKWVAELDEDIHAEIQREYDERQQKQAESGEPPQLPSP